MFTQQECLELFLGLSKLMPEFGLEWVMVQVLDQINLGKVVEREIETLKETRHDFFAMEIPERITYGKGPKATYPVTIPYTSAEQLDLLIKAIEQAVVNTELMEERIQESFQNIGPEWDGIVFRPEETSNRENVVAKIDHQRQENSEQLKWLLESIHSEIPL